MNLLPSSTRIITSAPQLPENKKPLSPDPKKTLGAHQLGNYRKANAKGAIVENTDKQYIRDYTSLFCVRPFGNLLKFLPYV